MYDNVSPMYCMFHYSSKHTLSVLCYVVCLLYTDLCTDLLLFMYCFLHLFILYCYYTVILYRMALCYYDVHVTIKHFDFDFDYYAFRLFFCAIIRVLSLFSHTCVICDFMHVTNTSTGHAHGSQTDGSPPPLRPDLCPG